MKCSVCGSKNVHEEIRDLPYSFKSVATVIPAVRLRCCYDCKESMLNWNEAERVSEMHLSHNRKVNDQLSRSKK